MKRHLVMVGLPGAGKSAVGRQVAGILGCAFCDLDTLISTQSAMTITALFDRRGERAFREMEHQAFERAIAEPPHVVAPGGGWAAQPGNLERAHGHALSVYLRCTPETAAERLASVRDRPLLQGDLIGRLRALAAERRAFYEEADAVVATDDRTVDDVASEVVALARSRGGW